MKKQFPLFVQLYLLISIGGLAQQAVPDIIRASNTIDRLFDPNGLASSDLLYGLPLPPGKVIGDSYLSRDWKRGSIMLYEGNRMIEGYYLRYDIQTDELEVKVKGGVKVLQGSKVKSFIWIDSISNAPSFYVNGRDYKDAEGKVISGFFEVLSDGRIPVFQYIQLRRKKANYVVQFDVGSRDERILKERKMFFLKNDKLFEVPNSRKKLLPVFGKDAQQIDEFIQLNSLNLIDTHHIRAVFDYYNSL